jgi:CBS domain containing-hemolysin-like protein
MIELLLIAASVVLIVACGAFVAGEFSLVTVDRASAQRAAEAGDRQAAGVVAALRSLSTQLSAAQVGITLTNLLIGYLAEPAIADVIDGPLESAGLSEGAANGVALVLAIVLATGLTMIFGELVPKNLAIARPLATAKRVQGFLRGFARATAWIVRGLNAAANRVLLRVGIEPQEELASARSPEELASLVRRSAEHGTLEVGTATLLQRSLAFGDRRAADVMTPWVKVHAVGADAPVIEVLRTAKATGRSRFPVLAAQPGQVAGVVHVKDAMGVPPERRDAVPVGTVARDPLLVPSSVELDALLPLLRREGLQLGIVVDEWGNLDGIVALEDLVEEIVGDVRDEHDVRDDSVRPDGNDRWNLSGLLRPDEVARAVGVRLPENDEYETLAGLVAVRLERMPVPGDTIELDADVLDDEDVRRRRVRLTVLSMDGLRVDRVRLELLREPRGDGA